MGFADVIILSLYLMLVLGIGWFARARGGGNVAFFLAGRKMGVLPIGLSVMVTVFSAINYLAFPGEVFGFGLYVIVSLPVFFLAVWPVNRIWMPFFHAMRLTSAHEYLGRRFDGRVRSLAGGLFIAWRLFWMATALYASGAILGIMTGWPPSAIILLGGLVATVYTSIGGMRAVMWTDVAQFGVLFGGIVLGLMGAAEGGFGEIMRVARDGGRLRPFIPFDPAFLSPSPWVRMTLWSGVLGVFVAFLTRYGADQVVMQRYFTARDLKCARRGLWLSAAASVLALGLLAVFGLAVYAHAVSDGALDGIVWEALPPPQRNALMMRQMARLLHAFPAGVTGLVVAGLMAATMSSIDSGINACSAVCVSDFQRWRSPPPRAGAKPPECHDLRRDRFLTVLLGGLSTVLALLLLPMIGRTNSLFMIVNKVINGLGSPLLALFLCGMFFRRANAPGVLAGGIMGIAASLAISLALDGLALQYYALVNLLAALAPCLVFSWVFGRLGYRAPRESLAWTWAAWRRRDQEAKASRL